jgi:hypothetical protein
MVPQALSGELVGVTITVIHLVRFRAVFRIQTVTTIIYTTEKMGIQMVRRIAPTGGPALLLLA